MSLSLTTEGQTTIKFYKFSELPDEALEVILDYPHYSPLTATGNVCVVHCDGELDSCIVELVDGKILTVGPRLHPVNSVFVYVNTNHTYRLIKSLYNLASKS